MASNVWCGRPQCLNLISKLATAHSSVVQDSSAVLIMSARKSKKGSIEFSTARPRSPVPAGEAYSDGESLVGNKFRNTKGYYPSLSSSLPSKSYGGHRYDMLDHDAENQLTEAEDQEVKGSNDEFFDNQLGNKLVRTGRQRKRLAARTKGGEFQSRRSKKRVYFCSIASEIDIEKLFDYLVAAGGLLFGWQYHVHNDVLHLYKAGVEESAPVILNKQSIIDPHRMEEFNETSAAPIMYKIEQQLLRPNLGSDSGLNDATTTSSKIKSRSKDFLMDDQTPDSVPIKGSDHASKGGSDHVQNPFRISGNGAQEVFVFDFGAVVFWGFSRGEETNLLKTVRQFVTRGEMNESEFHSSVDDMAFVTSPDAEGLSVANDVITLPDDSVAKQRLSISFAIAQSSVLAVFEARIEKMVEEYKYIPEMLAAEGKVRGLDERKLGQMIGAVYVVRHDVNLHTEILDTPDFFWKEEKFEQDYKMLMGYLEMNGRTEILNKRLDMLRELLDVLQQQMENAHGVKLEMIVIYLIVAEVVLQLLAILSK